MSGLLYVRIALLSALSRLFYAGIAKTSNQLFQPFDKTQLLLKTHVPWLMRFDAFYFLKICSQGYQAEHETAFLPLLPILTNFLHGILNNFLKIFWNKPLSLLTVGIVLNNILFIISAMLLHRISKQRYGIEVANTTVLFYNLAPASIFAISFYSESLYSFLFLTFLTLLENNMFKFFIPFLLCCMSLTRSNALLNVLFFVYKPKNFKSFLFQILCLLSATVPFSLFQFFIKTNFNKNSFFPYTEVQRKYWKHGFLKFYHYKKNIPNLVAGLPFILFILLNLRLFIIRKFFHKKRLSLKYLKKKDPYVQTMNFNSLVMFVILGIKALMCLIVIHPQTFVRLMFYNPVWYWCATILSRKEFVWHRIIIFGFVFYGAVQAALFGAYYPPA